MNPENREQMIRDRAYVIWVEEGRPEGRADAHWRDAEQAIDEEEGAMTSLTDITGEPQPMVTPNR